MTIDVDAEVKEGPLDTLIAEMFAGPTQPLHPRFWFLSTPTTKPYGEPPDSHEISSVFVQGVPGHYVGITQLFEGSNDELLVSDSFSPCVPVVIFKPERTVLVHCNGIGRASDINHARDQGTVIVVRKSGGKQRDVAEAFLTSQNYQMIPDYYCTVPTIRMIGVVVYGATKTILVYMH